MACEAYDLQKERLHNAMHKQHRVNMIGPADAKNLAEAKNTVRLAALSLELHVLECDRCQAEGNRPVVVTPL